MTCAAAQARRLRLAAAPLLVALAGHAAIGLAQEQSTRLIEVAVAETVGVELSGVSHAMVVDDTVCRVDVVLDTLRIVGLRRGETIVVVWRNDTPESLLVRVVAPAPPKRDVQPTREELDAIGHGTVGTLAHIGTTSRSGKHTISMLTPFAWTEGTAQRRFTMNGQVQGNRAVDASTFNLDTLSAQWVRGTTTVQVLDVVVNLDGGAPARITPTAPVGGFAVRGADAIVSRGKNTIEAFGGTTLPYLAASRQLTGVNFSRQSSDRIYIDATTAAVRAPLLDKSIAVGHQVSAFQTVGVTDRLTDRAAVQVHGGAGSTGFYGQGATAWQTDRVSAFVTATGSSPQFGLNQLQLVYAPSAAVSSGANWNVVRRLRTGVSYSHTTMQATTLFPASSTSDYVSSTVNLSPVRSQTLFANTTWNRTIGGLGAAGQTLGRRVDIGLSSQFGRRVANSLQLSAGSLADPLQLNSRGEVSFRDNATLMVRGGSINLSASHDRLRPSLVSRLRQQLNLLAPGLQPLFLENPVTFVSSSLMPADVRELLSALEPVDAQVSLSGQFQIGRRLTMSPTASYLHRAQSSSLHSRNEMFGYSLTWRATPTLELQSTLSNALIFDPRLTDLTRTTIFGIGIRKTLNGAPGWIAPSAGYRVQGRVFRDLNVDGIPDESEPGLPGLTVRLNNGRTTRTDVRGCFEFDGLSPGEYRLVLPLEQLGSGVRLTTPIERDLRLYEHRIEQVNFGVVNFSRLIGAVFNDYALDGVRQADALGLRKVALTIEGQGVDRRIATDGAGEFEVDDLAPGSYRISIDLATLPANYEPAVATVAVDLAPSSTTTVSMAVRALRSIAGGVFLRASNGSLIPLRGIRVRAHASEALTDDDGRFMIRNLPAGELTVTLEPAAALPRDLATPAGRLRMPAGPTQVENATIVIDNPRLIEYLAPSDSLPPSASSPSTKR
jgi:hypothetical protein